MKTYKVIYTETLVHHFYVDGNTIEDAKETFNNYVNHGEIDFSDGCVVDTDIKIKEVE